MKKILYLFLAGYGVLYAQNQKFVYEYKFVPDSTNTSDIKSEITHLEITPKGSVFIVMKFIKVILWRKLIWKNNSKLQVLSMLSLACEKDYSETKY